MNALRPFFRLLGRASVFWLSAFGLFAISMIVSGLAQPEAQLGLRFDAVLVAVFAIPVAAGWLAGALIQELQHTTVAMLLPSVRSRIATGFLAAGLALTVVVVGLVALTVSSPQNLPVLFAVGLGAYGLGAILLDPLSSWVTCFNVIVVVAVIGGSYDVARFADDRPWLTVIVAIGVGVVGFARLFARSTFRRKPFRATSPFPGSFALEKTRQLRSRQLIQDGPMKTGWSAGYLGTDSWRWVRAAVHEVYGANSWKNFARSVSRAWGLPGLFLLYAWVDKGEMSFGEAMARSINDALFRSPHQPQFGEHGGPYPLVMLALAAAGVTATLFSAVTLNDAMVYPLSRRQRATVCFRGGLVDAANFLLVVGLFLFAVGHLTGWLVGFEIRFDFMPFFFRVLLVTVILMPLAHWGRLRLQAATRRKAGNTMIGVIFGVIGYVIAVGIGTFVSPRLFGSPLLELAALAAALLVSQLIYRQTLTSYYRTVDLA